MSKPYKTDEWNIWTAKSNEIPFKTIEKSVGDGEYKLGKEYDVAPLGQNSAYDLDVLGEKWEVKKLDSDNSFRLGVEVSSNYTPIIAGVIRILEKIVIIKDQLIDSETSKSLNTCIEKIENSSGNTKTLLLDGLRKNEVSSSNLDKANEIIETLKTLIFNGEQQVTLHSSFNGEINDYSLIDAFKKLSIEEISIEDKLLILGNENIYNQLLITNAISDDLRQFDTITLREKLNVVVRDIFNEVKLVLVKENKGYKPIENLETIVCNRITSGSPRCKIIEHKKHAELVLEL